MHDIHAISVLYVTLRSAKGASYNARLFPRTYEHPPTNARTG